MRAALRHNLRQVRRVAPDSRVMAVVKANAYGHGLVPAAKALADADAFAVARLEEGLALRNAGLAQSHRAARGRVQRRATRRRGAGSFELVVHEPEQLELLEGLSGTHRS